MCGLGISMINGTVEVKAVRVTLKGIRIRPALWPLSLEFQTSFVAEPGPSSRGGIELSVIQVQSSTLLHARASEGCVAEGLALVTLPQSLITLLPPTSLLPPHQHCPRDTHFPGSPFCLFLSPACSAQDPAVCPQCSLNLFSAFLIPLE